MVPPLSFQCFRKKYVSHDPNFFFERVCVFPENNKSLYMISISCLENFLTHGEVWRFWKSWHLSEYSNMILSFIFSKYKFFSLFLTHNLIGVPYGHDFLLKQRSRFREHSRYPEHVRKVHRKYSRGIRKSSAKKMSKKARSK